MTYSFWMDRHFASEPIEISHSLEPLARPLDPRDFHVVFGSFEGEWQVIRFKNSVTSEFHPLVESSIHQQSSEEVPSWLSTLDRERYLEYVEEIRNEVSKGWVYQVNACRLLASGATLDLAHLFHAVQGRHHAPAAGYLKSERWEIASASPETFFRVSMIDGRRSIRTSPIKGTSKNGVFKEKDSSENVMIVDLMRNDISTLCKPGTVKVPRLLGVEQHPGLFHLVSDVQGELKESVSWKEILERLSPAGSISGAPKSSAIEVIRRFEPYRGAYCGTLGWIKGEEAHFSVLIRTFFKDSERGANETYFGTGAGITWGSDADEEWLETELKAARLIEIAQSVAKDVLS